MKPRFFRSGAELRRWLTAHHADRSELLVGFHKKGSSVTGITYREALDEALCFGWIDGVRQSLGEASYTIRFTPRKANSYWSEVNIRRAHELIAEGRMRPSGLKAFERRDEAQTRRYSHERDAAELGPDERRTFKERPRAWEFFQAQPPSYRKPAIWWVVSAKREDTRRRRLARLIDHSGKGERLPQFVSPSRRPGSRE